MTTPSSPVDLEPSQTFYTLRCGLAVDRGGHGQSKSSRPGRTRAVEGQSTGADRRSRCCPAQPVQPRRSRVGIKGPQHRAKPGIIKTPLGSPHQTQSAPRWDSNRHKGGAHVTTTRATASTYTPVGPKVRPAERPPPRPLRSMANLLALRTSFSHFYVRCDRI
jgi:hypothetical protein